MFPEIERFGKWLCRQGSDIATQIHDTSGVSFFAWAGKPPDAIILHDMDAYVARCRGLGYAPELHPVLCIARI